MASSARNATISFDLIAIPIRLYGTARTNRNHLDPTRRSEPQRS